MKRKIFGFVFAVLFALSCTCSAWAASDTMLTFDNLEIKLSLPTDIYILTRGMSANDLTLKQLNLTPDDVDTSLESNSAYVDAFDSTGEWEIFLISTDSVYKDFDQMDSTSLEVVADWLVSSYQTGDGITLNSYEIYETDATRFLHTELTQVAGSTAYAIERYVFSYHGNLITVMGQCIGKDNAWKNKLKNIVDSISLLNATAEKTEETVDPDAEPIDFEDDYVSFTVPAGWEETALSKDYSTLRNKFILSNAGGICILYGREDVWEAMSESEQKGYTREDVDNTVFTKANVATAFSVSKSDVEKETYGNTDYYIAKISAVQTMAVHVENGYMYIFQFSGTDENKYYSDFESMLESVEFAAQIENKSEKTSGGTLSGEEIAIIACIGAVIIAVILIAFWYVGTAKENKKTCTSTTAGIKKDYTGVDYAIRYCHRCGYHFDATVEKCPQCGAIIPKIETIIKQ